MKKVLFVISTLNTGGAQRAFSNIIMNLPEDWEIDILLNDTDNIVYPYKGKIIDLGMRPQADKMSLPYQFKVTLRRLYLLRKIKKENNYDACVSALESANFANVLSGKKYCKCILSVRVFYEKGWANKFTEFLVTMAMRFVYRRADKIVAVSKGIEKNLIEQYKIPTDKVTTIYNGYNVEKVNKKAMEEVHEKLQNLQNEKIVITSGRLSKQKGQWHLIKAFSEVIKKVPDAQLVILGEGELRDELETLVKYYGLEESVLLPGFLENPFAVIKRSALFVLPSLFEGYPNALAEAMICGIPCIATDCKTGPREILGDSEYGILLPNFRQDDLWDNIEIEGLDKQLADMIEKMLTDKELYRHYKQKAQERSLDFDMRRIIGAWEQLVC